MCAEVPKPCIWTSSFSCQLFYLPSHGILSFDLTWILYPCSPLPWTSKLKTPPKVGGLAFYGHTWHQSYPLSPQKAPDVHRLQVCFVQRRELTGPWCWVCFLGRQWSSPLYVLYPVKLTQSLSHTTCLDAMTELGGLMILETILADTVMSTASKVTLTGGSTLQA